mgnify:CR=1 FL=1
MAQALAEPGAGVTVPPVVGKGAFRPQKGAEAGDWLARLIGTLLTNPAAYVTEMAGAILLVPLLWAVAGRVGLLRLLRTGRVD